MRTEALPHAPEARLFARTSQLGPKWTRSIRRPQRLDARTLPIYIFRKVRQKEIATMFVKITAKRQVTFPARVLEALGVKPGDRIELEEGPDGFVLRARHVDRARLAPLRGKLRRGIGTFDLEAFRNKPHDRTLRD